MANPHQLKRQRRDKVRGIANRKGVYAVRRTLREQSFEVFEKVNDVLTADIRGLDRLFTPATLGITVVGFSRFREGHKFNGPATREIADTVSTGESVLPARLGKLTIFGSGNVHKLAFTLESPGLVSEIREYEEKFDAAGFPLIDDYHAEEEFAPHCSVAYLHSENVGHHGERTTLKRYNNLVAKVGAEPGTVVMLEPATFRQHQN